MKTPIRRLDSLTHNDTAATKLINDNFEALQQGIEDALSRSGKTPNFMDAPLDMNMNRIINIADPVDDYDLANKHYVDEQVAAEALARQSADNTLQQHIDDEATTRQNADSTLQGNIDAEETRAKAAEKAITDTLDTYGNIVTHDVDEFATAAQGAKADTAVQPSDLGNGTITITQGGVVKGTFTTNQAGDTTIEVDEGSAPVVTDDTVYIESVAITSQPGTTSGHVDVTSYVDPDKMYYPLLQINGHSFVDIKKSYYNWCVFRKNDSVRTVSLYKVDPDVMVSAYFNILLIPIETDPSTVVVEGLSDGLGGTGEEAVWGNIAGTLSDQTDLKNALDAKQDSLSTAQLNAINSGITSAKVSQYDSYAAGKANVGLDNLSAAGQLIIDSQNGTISNCILEIPQNIKLTLENNVVILKAGSILVNSGSTYSTFTTTSDLTVTAPNTPSTEYMIFMYGNNNFAGATLDNIVSGSTDSKSGVPYHVWFDTTNKIINRYGSDGTTAIQVRYPICIVKTTSAGGSWDSFAKDSNGNDMIFNGAGFIGHHAFVYPNVNGLIPKGFNDEGTLKSTNKLNNQLLITELQQGFSTLFLNTYGSGVNVHIYSGEVETNDDLPLTNVFYYVKSRNFISRKNGSGVLSEGTNIVPFIEYTYDGTTVTQFDIRQPYEGARNLLTDDIEEQIGDIDTILHNINSGS